jgi:hypothetical protein
LSLGYYDGAQQDLRVRRAIERKLGAARQDAFVAAVMPLGTGLAFLVLQGINSWRLRHLATHAKARRTLIVHVLGVAAIFLCIGLVAPLLNISIEKEVQWLGRVVLQHESTGLLSSIGSLIQAGHSGIAATIALFSVIAPSVKLAISLGVILLARGQALAEANRIIKVVGRPDPDRNWPRALLLRELRGAFVSCRPSA